jgi:RNA polymerase sigma-70 factor (ECF subfamily)
MLTMAKTALGTLLQNLRRSLRCGEADFTDGDLLDGFLSRRDEDAFAALVQRHGPMVLGVCRRILQNEADVEDAFQAVFLVLVRKAGSIHPRRMVGNWLYGVAHSTALKARAMRSKRRTKESEAAARTKLDDSADEQARLTELLDEELKALPDKYRAAIVLCDLEGSSIKEAARQLGCPPGTIGTRLARGRSLLSRRLRRHGLTVSSAMVATAIATSPADAAVPLLLMHSTIKTAISAAAGRAMAVGLISARVVTLTEGVLKTMLLKKLKIGTALLSAVVILLAGAGLTFSARAVGPPQAVKADAQSALAEEKPRDEQKAVAAVPAVAGVAAADDITVATAPPVVVQTVPKAGSIDIDAKLGEIKVTFSKDMLDESWSWSSVSAGTYPKINGKPKYLKDKRTCVLPVKLEPGKTYAVWINSERFENFKDADGKPAVPYLLVFQTKK